MQSLFGKRGVLLAGLLAATLGAALPSRVEAKPEPRAKPRTFRLFARSLGALTINRVYCGLSATGEVCVDSTNSSTIGGGYWPKGTADQYIFNSGLQIAGKVSNPGGSWDGDVTGAFFFDPKGTTQHGEAVTPIYNTADPADAAFISDSSASCDEVCQAAKVSKTDALSTIFYPLLRGRARASQGDVWWLSWDGNPANNAGRPHPLGVLVETRGMGWNYPAGNQDILYFAYTFYNVTATDPAVYANVRPGMRDILVRKARDFKSLNEAQFPGVTIPAGGYTITDAYAAFAADNDVASAGANYSSVNLPFALGYSYEATFEPPAGWSFDPGIFAAPFFAGPGFIGVKYLKSPTGPGAIQLYSNTINGAGFNDPANVTQLYRYLSGNISTAAGDKDCTFDPATTHICFIYDIQADTRFFQSSTALTLAPGEFRTIVVAYIFAPPVNAPGYTGQDVKPFTGASPLNTNNVAQLTAGNVPLVEKIAGFAGFEEGAQTTDGIAQQSEFKVVPGSLLGKATTAQQVFNNGFLLPFAPDSPDFFLVPGDNQVTIIWRPSVSESTGDPYFGVASQPTVTRTDTTVVTDSITNLPDTSIVTTTEANLLYDPNYRQFDVEGYRIYRGRIDAPNELQLIAQFDYAGTSLTDFRGLVYTPQDPAETGCAPELGIQTDCGAAFDSLPPGTPFVDNGTNTTTTPLVGQIIQTLPGQRVALASGNVLVTKADTATSGGGKAGTCAPSACPDLEDTGVPFVYVDRDVRNNFRYFYSVTAFDVNSALSGPSSLESPRATKAVTPVAGASNYQNTVDIQTAYLGRGESLDPTKPVPSIDPTTGIFSGPFPAANGADLGFVGEFVKQVVAAPGAVTATLDSISLGAPYAGVPTTYHWTVVAPVGSSQVDVTIAEGATTGSTEGTGAFQAIQPDPALQQRYGGSGTYSLAGQLTQTVPNAYYMGAFGRGCVNGAPGFDKADNCSYNGSRWFEGPSPQKNETEPNPTAGNNLNFDTTTFPDGDTTNAGALPGVIQVVEMRSYQNVQSLWRAVESAMGTAMRAADFNVYWGAGGKVDSVIDVTHNVPVPFSTGMGGTWGILNQSATTGAGSYDTRPGELTATDIGCVAPLKTLAGVGATGGLIACSAATPYALSETAVPGTIALFDAGVSRAKTAVAKTTPGIGFYLAGHFYMMELEGGAVPAAGTIWTMRSYAGGGISGGNGDLVAGDEGPYVYTQVHPRPFTAVGAQIKIGFDVVNKVAAATKIDLEKVHTVPDPYYVTNAYEQTTDAKVLKFVNLPQQAIIRIYSSGGVLVNVLEHNSNQFGGAETWNLRNRNNQVVASGVYFYHIESGDARRVGRFTVVNFAQ